MKFVVTGGLGFIGRVLVKKLYVRYPDADIVVLDKMGIGSDPLHFKNKFQDRVEVIKCDLKKQNKLKTLKKRLDKIDCVFHLAAESHVDRSINNPTPFIESNVVGTFNMLFNFKDNFEKFIHVSTDEVYGSLNPKDPESKETDPLDPSSIYSSSKASSDLIVKSAYHTYKMPVLITRCCNNFGPGQNEEKFIPTIILNALKNKPIPVYGNGKNMREWISVDHHATALMDLYENGKVGEIYNIGSGYRTENIIIVKEILTIMNKSEKLIKFVKDRLGHDICYKLNSNKLKQIIKLPKYDDVWFSHLLKQTVDYYVRKIK